MREITINGVTYTIKFSYRAAKYQKCVQVAFEILSGAMMLGEISDVEKAGWSDMIRGMTKQVSMIPTLCDTFFYAGTIESEKRPISEEAAGDLLIQYMEENNKTYTEIYHSLIECMEEDGFFEKSGITEMINVMNQSVSNAQDQTDTPEKVKKPRSKKKEETTEK